MMSSSHLGPTCWGTASSPQPESACTHYTFFQTQSTRLHPASSSATSFRLASPAPDSFHPRAFCNLVAAVGLHINYAFLFPVFSDVSGREDCLSQDQPIPRDGKQLACTSFKCKPTDSEPTRPPPALWGSHTLATISLPKSLPPLPGTRQLGTALCYRAHGNYSTCPSRSLLTRPHPFLAGRNHNKGSCPQFRPSFHLLSDPSASFVPPAPTWCTPSSWELSNRLCS